MTYIVTEISGPFWCVLRRHNGKVVTVGIYNNRRLAESMRAALSTELVAWRDAYLDTDAGATIHAHWSYLRYDEAICTSCGHVHDTPFSSGSEAREKWSDLPPYCEMCGAAMDEEVAI